MRYALDVEQHAFKQMIEDFLKESLPPALADKVRCGAPVSKSELASWTRILNAQGWAAPNWPEKYGGTGWNLMQRHLFDVACRQAHAPALSGFGFNMVGPAIIKYGTEAQKTYFLPKILNADLWFCQGYSEPEAGSDLASVRTRAVRQGDEYVVSGQKTWTTGAEDADWIFALVRTDFDVQQQRGISFLLIDLSSPGVNVEPLYAFNGKRLWNQVFFSEVRVPVSQCLGEENRGWTVAKSLLGDERLLVSRVAENKRILSVVEHALATQRALGVCLPLALDEEVAALNIRLQALEMTSLRILSDADAGEQIGAEPSMLKLKGSELVQDIDELLFRCLDHFVLPTDTTNYKRAAIGEDYTEYAASGRYHHRGYTIAGGSSEVQHNIIAKQVLGL